MQVNFNVSIEVERQAGKFASRDEITQALQSALEDGLDGADLSTLGADGESVYDIIDTTVEVEAT